MDITRRDFLKLSGLAGASLLLGDLNLKPIEAYAAASPITWARETATICPYCAVGCGALVHTDAADNVVEVEGNPDHVINQGSLCSKGSALYQIANQLPTQGELDEFYATGKWPTGKRLTRILYRARGATGWTEIRDWDTALSMIAQRVKNTRDASFETNYMRTLGIAAFGGAAHDNEECSLMRKLYTGLGMVQIEHQARI